MSHQIADAEVTIKTAGSDEETVDEAFRTAPQWSLIPEEWREELGKIEGQARRVLASASVQFAAKGSSLLPIHRATEVFGRLRALRQEFYAVRDRFCEQYSQILRDVQTKLGPELFAHASSKLPSNNEVSSKFKMVWAIIPLAGQAGPGEDYWAELTTLVERVNDNVSVHGQDDVHALQEHIERRHEAQLSAFDNDQMLLDVVKEARQQMASMVHESIEAMVHEPRQEVAAAVQNMLDAIRDERTVRQGTLDQITRAFERLKGFSFLADNQLLAQIRAVEGKIKEISPKQLNSSRDLGLKLAGALRPVLQAATDQVQAAKAGQQFRRIRPARDIEPVAS